MTAIPLVHLGLAARPFGPSGTGVAAAVVPGAAEDRVAQAADGRAREFEAMRRALDRPVAIFIHFKPSGRRDTAITLLSQTDGNKRQPRLQLLTERPSYGSATFQAAATADRVVHIGGDSMPGATDPVLNRRKLRIALRQAREAAGLTQREAAQELEWSQSKLIRIESGTVSTSVTDLRALMGLYAITEPQTMKGLEEAARHSRSAGWWTPFTDVLSHDFHNYLGYEEAAEPVRAYHPVPLDSGWADARRHLMPFSDTRPWSTDPVATEPDTLFFGCSLDRLRPCWGNGHVRRWVASADFAAACRQAAALITEREARSADGHALACSCRSTGWGFLAPTTAERSAGFRFDHPAVFVDTPGTGIDTDLRNLAGEISGRGAYLIITSGSIGLWGQSVRGIEPEVGTMLADVPCEPGLDEPGVAATAVLGTAGDRDAPRRSFRGADLGRSRTTVGDFRPADALSWLSAQPSQPHGIAMAGPSTAFTSYVTGSGRCGQRGGLLTDGGAHHACLVRGQAGRDRRGNGGTAASGSRSGATEGIRGRRRHFRANDPPAWRECPAAPSHVFAARRVPPGIGARSSSGLG
ncbi:helix-turn-helix transcriptional regulator [Streptomyces asoensis]|uniref:helix-turn-helix domain-containing protein n=1 Tax=Streptomyces asoensis TaxID=249586 RepID=UPI0033FDD8E8